MERENKEDEIKVETIQGISFSDIILFNKTETASIGPKFFISPVKLGAQKKADHILEIPGQGDFLGFGIVSR